MLHLGGGIGQSRTFLLLLRKAHLKEVTVNVWPKVLKQICKMKNIHALQIKKIEWVVATARERRRSWLPCFPNCRLSGPGTFPAC
jgi:hypothetical protein